METKVLVRSFALAALTALASAGFAVAQECSLTVALTAGQNYEAGTVTATAANGQVCVSYERAGDWLLAETHLAIASSLQGLPQTKSGNPRPGQFPYSATHNPPVSEYTYCVTYPYENGLPIWIATHAVVRRGGSGGGAQQETAWSGDLDFPGANWATYFVFEPLACEIDT